MKTALITLTTVLGLASCSTYTETIPAKIGGTNYICRIHYDNMDNQQIHIQNCVEGVLP